MRVQRPGLIVIVVVLVVSLVYLWYGPAWTTQGNAAENGNGKTERSEQAVADLESETAGQKEGSPSEAGRNEIPSGPRYKLRGTVLRRGETPVLGAVVVAYRGSPNDRRLNMTSMFAQINGSRNTISAMMGKDRGEVAGRAIVQAGGSFALHDLPTRHLRLYLDHDFYGLAQPVVVHIDAAPPLGGRDREQDQEASIILRPYLGGHIVGRIQDFVSGPGDKVRLISEMDPIFMMQNPQDFMGYMMNAVAREAIPGNANGRFEFRAIVPSTNINIAYRGNARENRRVGLLGPLILASGQRREVVIRTVGCGALIAHITCASQPVQHANARLVPAEFRGQNFAAQSGLHGSSGADGTCEVDRLLPGTYNVAFTCEGYVDVDREVTIRSGQDTRIDVVLDRGGSVKGQILDPQGEPVADAHLRIIPGMKVPMFGDLTKLTGEDLLVESARGSRQVSNAAGEFTLGGIADDEPFAIAAWHEDFVGGFARDVQRGDADIVIQMARAADLHGIVLDDETGEHVENFTAATLVRMAMVIERPSRSLAVTDSSDGAFSLERVPAGTATLQVQAQGFAAYRKSVKITAGENFDAGTIRLRKGGVIRGIVRTASGEPAPGVTVGRKATGMLDNPMLQAMFGAESATTNQAGHFELIGLAPGGVILKAASPSAASGVTKRLKIRAGEVLENVEIVLGAGGGIDGELELAEGLSAKGWMVMVTNQKGGSMRSEMIGDDGKFRFRHIDPGRYDVQAMQVDWMRRIQSEKMGMFRPGQKFDLGKMIQSANSEMVKARCRVKEGEVTEVHLDGSDLGEDGVKLTVRVTLGDRPMAAGWLEVERIADGQITQSLIESGVAKFESVQPGKFRLIVRTGMTMTPVGDASVIDVPLAKTHTTRVRLAGGRVEGKVVDQATNAALQLAVVRIVSAKGSAADQIEEIGFAITNEEGEFSFEGLDDGRYSLFANDSFFNMSDKTHGGRLDDVEIRGGGSVERVILRARRAARATVRVSDPSDLAVGRTMILAVDKHGKPLSTLPTFTDKAGEATLQGLPPGPMRVVALSGNLVPGYSDIELIQNGRETEFLVTMGKGPRVKVRIEDAKGKPVVGARLSARWKDGPWIPISLVTQYDAATGRLDLGHLPPIAVEFRVHSPGVAPFVVQRTLPSSSSVELVFTAPR